MIWMHFAPYLLTYLWQIMKVTWFKYTEPGTAAVGNVRELLLYGSLWNFIKPEGKFMQKKIVIVYNLFIIYTLFVVRTSESSFLSSNLD